jgi:hypothetical protein
MSITAAAVRTHPIASPTTSLRRTTVVAGLAASAATTAAATAMHAVGVSFNVGGEMIPLLGFAQLTMIGALIGGVLLAALNRRSIQARTRFVQTTMALTAVSCVPSLTLGDDFATKLALAGLHVLAAAIVVTALARHAR